MIWVIGHTGLLGSELCRQLDAAHISWIGSSSETDISNPTSLEIFANSHDSAAGRTGNACSRGKVPGKIRWVINCAALTDVKEAEKDPEKAEKVNASGPKHIARTARQIGAKLIHISTADIFDGSSELPYTELSPAFPVNKYGKSKLIGDEIVQKEMTQYYIIRASRLFGNSENSYFTNLFNSLKNQDLVKVPGNRKYSFVSTKELAALIIKLMETSEKATSLFGKKSALPYGIYNFADTGFATEFEFAEKVYELGKKHKKISHECTITETEENELKALKIKEPDFTGLNTAKIQTALNIKIPSWQESLEALIKGL